MQLREAIVEFASARRGLWVALALALLNGLLFVFVVPPWQHYDEPGHFEYTWLIARRGGLPRPGDYDLEMRRGIAASMIEHGFFEGLDYLPDLNSSDQPAWIGVPQLDEPPLYYLLVSIPLRLLASENVELLLYAARLASVLLFWIVIVAGRGIAREIAPPSSRLPVWFPISLALFPGLANLMASVNDDAGAVAVFSLFLWGCVRLIQRGITWDGLILAAGSAVLCYLTKNTTFIGFPLLLVALLFGFWRGRKRWVGWALLAAGGLAAILATFSWGDAIHWYRATLQTSPDRRAEAGAVVGKYAFRLEMAAPVHPGWLHAVQQPLPEESVRLLAGKTVTLGAWMWASQPVEAYSPVLNDSVNSSYQVVRLGEEPAFFAQQVSLPQGVSRLWVSLPAVPVEPAGEAAIFYDGLVLAEGERPLEDPPDFNDEDGSAGVWGGQPFVNHLRNASAEAATVRVRPWLDSIARKVLPPDIQPSFLLSYLMDWEGAGRHYETTFLRLFRSFWGEFGWGHVPLLGHKPYRAMAAIALIGVAGSALLLWRRRNALPWEALFLLGFSLPLIWASTFTRGASHLMTPWFYVPVARYAYIVVIPTWLLLSAGWREALALARGGLPGLKIPAPVLSVVYFGLLLLLDGYSLLSILYYYNG